jgi:hypothetical protein
MLVEERSPDVLGEPEVRDAFAVQVTDLASAYLEGELPSRARRRDDPGQEPTSSVIRSLTRWSTMAPPRARCHLSQNY